MFTDPKRVISSSRCCSPFLPGGDGAFAHSFIKAQLFRPEIVCIALIAGGLVLLAVDELQLEARADDVYEITPLMALKIASSR